MPAVLARKPFMPGSLSVRNLDDGLILSLKRRAARHGHSAEAEVRDILRQALAQEADAGFDDLAAELRALTAGRTHTPAETLLRESRDER
jgi:plasmid stability protein